MPAATIKINFPGKRIKEAKVLDDGSCELFIETEVKDSESKEKEILIPDSWLSVPKNSEFILIDVESISQNDEFMKHKPVTEREKELKTLISKAIKKKVKNFYRPRGDMSITDDGEGICFAPGNQPAVLKSFNWHKKAAKEFCPERNSRLGNKYEYALFLAVLIRDLVERGKSIEWAWNAVCNDSEKLGNFCGSPCWTYGFEPTGSRGICGYFDLGNTYKILDGDNKKVYFCLAGGFYDSLPRVKPLAYIDEATSSYEYPLAHSTGWLVIS